MTKKMVSVLVKQKLTFDSLVDIEKCPEEEFSEVDCVKIGDDYFLPTVEWTKYVPPERYAAEDGAGGFEPVEGAEWETIHHAIMDERTRVKAK